MFDVFDFLRCQRLVMYHDRCRRRRWHQWSEVQRPRSRLRPQAPPVAMRCCYRILPWNIGITLPN